MKMIIYHFNMRVRKKVKSKNGIVSIRSSVYKIHRCSELSDFEKLLMKSQKEVNRLMDSKVKDMHRHVANMMSTKVPFSRWEVNKLLGGE